MVQKSLVLISIITILSVVNCSSFDKARASKPYKHSARTAEAAVAVDGQVTGENKFSAKKPEDFKRQIVYNAFVNVEAKKPADIRDWLLGLTEKKGGFMISATDYQVIVRVPAAILKGFLGEIKARWPKYSDQINANDVTDEYYDTKLRLENARKLRDRFAKLLVKAKNVSETLEIERELSRISGEIELLEGRLSRLKQTVAFSKVTVTIHREYTPVKEKDYEPGYLGYPFYYAYKGLVAVGEGVLWLFVRGEEVK